MNDAAKELGRKGGQAKSAAKTAEAGANASKPRKKPMPELPTKQLMHLAWLELITERDRCAVVGERCDGLKINGHDLIDVKWNHLQAMEWQPIETAPRDGTRILLYRPLAERTNDDPIDIKRGVPRDNGCWEETIPSGLSGENYTDGACRATHWMPLPEVPSVQGQGEDTSAACGRSPAPGG